MIGIYYSGEIGPANAGGRGSRAFVLGGGNSSLNHHSASVFALSAHTARP